MATAEFEELKLSVVLVDDASSGLAALRAEMRNFNTDSIRFIRNARESSESYKRLGRETDEAVKGLRAAGQWFSRVGGAVSLVTGAYYSTVAILAKFALEVEQVANAARMAGVSYADLRNVSEQMMRKGLSPETGGRILGAINALGMRLQSMEGVREFENAIRNSKIVLDPVQEQAYIQAMIDARGWQQRVAIAQNALANIEQKGREQGLQDWQIKIYQKEFLIKQQLPEELAIIGEITDTTKEQNKKWGHLEESAKIWNEITHTIILNVKTILAILNADSMAEDGPFFAMLTLAVDVTKFVDENIQTWIDTVTEVAELIRQTFAAKPEEEGPPKPKEIPPVEGLDPFNPGFSPTSFGGDDMPLKLEKLIKEFNEFYNNLRNAAPSGGPDVVPASFASLGSMATPGLQLPPAAAAGDIYTDKYPIWPGGGAKPTGSDVGPGSGVGAGGGSWSDRNWMGPVGTTGGQTPWDFPRFSDNPPRGGMRQGMRFGDGPPPLSGPGSGKYPFGTEGRFRGGYGALQQMKTTRGGIPLGGGDLPYNDVPGGGDLPETGRFRPRFRGVRTPGGIPLITPRGGEGGPGGPADPNWNPPTLTPEPVLPRNYPGTAGAGRFGGAFLGQAPGLDTPEERIKQALKGRSYSEREFVPGKSLSQGGTLPAPGSIQGKEEAIEEEQLERAPYWNRPGASGDWWWQQPRPEKIGDTDRSVIDRGMGNEMGGRLEGGIGLNVDVKGPPGVEATAEGSGIIDRTEVNREQSFGAD